MKTLHKKMAATLVFLTAIGVIASLGPTARADENCRSNCWENKNSCEMGCGNCVGCERDRYNQIMQCKQSCQSMYQSCLSTCH
jgi:hypothetical protein